MGEMQKLGLDDIVEILKAAGEPTRLRLLALLSHGDLTVTDLTDILGQSQPRISRHLKLLSEAALVDRYQEGAWAFFRLGQGGVAVSLARQLLDAIELHPGAERGREGGQHCCPIHANLDCVSWTQLPRAASDSVNSFSVAYWWSTMHAPITPV